MLLAYSSEHLQTDAFKNCSFRSILFYTLKQHSDYRSLIAKTFDGNTIKMKALSDIQVIKSKKQCFKLCFDRMWALVYTPIFCVIDQARPKNRAPRTKFVHPWYVREIQVCNYSQSKTNHGKGNFTPYQNQIQVQNTKVEIRM